MKLREITENYAALMAAIEENEGVLTDHLAKQLEITEANKLAKCEGYVSFIQDQEAFITRIDDEVKRLQAMKKTTVSRVDYLKNNLLNAVVQFGDVTLPFNKISIRESKSVAIIDEDEIHEVYWNEKVVRTVDKMAIKRAIEAGESVPGAMIATKENLSIK